MVNESFTVKYFLPVGVLAVVLIFALLLDMNFPESRPYNASEETTVHSSPDCRDINENEPFIQELGIKTLEEIKKTKMPPFLFISFIFMACLVSALGVIVFASTKSFSKLRLILVVVREIYIAFDAIFLITASLGVVLFITTIFLLDVRAITIVAVGSIFLGGCFTIARKNLIRFEDCWERYSRLVVAEQSELQYNLLSAFNIIGVEFIVAVSFVVVSIVSYFCWYYQIQNYFLFATTTFIFIGVLWRMSRSTFFSSLAR